MQSAYADKVSGEMPASVCAKLLEQYEAEQNALTSQVQEIENRMLTMRQDERDVDEFIARLKKYQNAEVLTREMSLALIDAITIDECVRGKQERDIHIYYKFIDKGYSGKTELGKVYFLNVQLTHAKRTDWFEAAHLNCEIIVKYRENC